MIDAVADDSFLSGLSGETQRTLFAVGVRREWPGGSALFDTGDPADGVFVVVEGVVKIMATAEDGDESVLALRSPGDVIGELAAIDGGRRSARATAVTEVAAVWLDTESFRAFLHGHAEAAVALLTELAGRLRQSDLPRVEFGADDATPRVARLLSELADRGTTPETGRVVEHVSHEELASLCGATREAVGRALRHLHAAGLVATDRRTITIHNLETLRRWGR